MADIKPGTLDDFAASMAARMESELNATLMADGLPQLSTDGGDQEVRDRRRLFVAIARGVVGYLRDNDDAIDVLRVDNTVVHPTINTDGI